MEKRLRCSLFNTVAKKELILVAKAGTSHFSLKFRLTRGTTTLLLAINDRIMHNHPLLFSDSLGMFNRVAWLLGYQ